MNEAAASPTYFWRGALWLAPGEVVPPGNWGRVVLGYGMRHNLFYREYVYERIRAAEFAAMPSRMRSAFAFCDEAVAGAFNQPNAPLLYRVQLVPGANAAKVDMQWLDVVPHTFDEADDCARHYWGGNETPQPQWEVLSEAGFTVVDRLPT